ncbi:ABC transporter H family member 2, partial [Aphis craccivora]
LKTRKQNIKKNKKDCKVVDQTINNLENDHIIVHTGNRFHNQMNECFVLLSDCNKLNIGYLINKRKKIKKNIKDSKVQNLSNFENNNAAVHTENKHTRQSNECFSLSTLLNILKNKHILKLFFDTCIQCAFFINGNLKSTLVWEVNTYFVRFVQNFTCFSRRCSIYYNQIISSNNNHYNIFHKK